MGARGNGVPLLERGEVPAGSVRSTSGGRGALLSGVFLNDDLPSLNVAGVGSTRSTSGGFAAVVRCPFERWLSVIECCFVWKRQVNFRGFAAVGMCVFER